MLSFDTEKVLDYEHISKICKECESRKEKLSQEDLTAGTRAMSALGAMKGLVQVWRLLTPKKYGNGHGHTCFLMGTLRHTQVFGTCMVHVQHAISLRTWTKPQSSTRHGLAPKNMIFGQNPMQTALQTVIVWSRLTVFTMCKMMGKALLKFVNWKEEKV